MNDVPMSSISQYTGYVQYTNKVLLQLIDTIVAKASKPPVIILMSDHGFREYDPPVDRKYQVMNQLCILLPNKNYTPFYEGMSNVNLFRVFFNSQFGQHFPLLRDSASFVRP